MLRCAIGTTRRLQHLIAAESIVLWDVETSGLNVWTDQVVELSALHPHSGEVFESLIRPNVVMSEAVTNIHGITNEALVSEQQFKDVWTRYLSWVRQFSDDKHRVLLLSHFAYNLDVPIIHRETSRVGCPIPEEWIFVDTSRVFRSRLGKEQRIGMASLCELYSLPAPSHRALSDCLTLWEVLKKLYPNDTLQQLAHFYRLKQKRRQPRKPVRKLMSPTWG